MKYRIAAVCFFMLLLICCSALADENGFCDPVPESLASLIEGTVRDCVCFAAPDGTDRAFLLLDGGWSLKGYTLREGQWIEDVDTTETDWYQDVYLVRHQPGQLRPDGSGYGDDQGYDIISKNGLYISFHWNGSSYSLCGWRDPSRYDGAVMIEGTKVSYYPKGSQMPEYEADAGDELTLYSWTWSFDDVPATPDEAGKRAAILPHAIRGNFPGYVLAEYEQYNSGTGADAVFVQAAEDKGGFLLRVIRADYEAERGQTFAHSLMDIPLSGRLKDTPAETLWQDRYTLFREPNALDGSRVPLPGRIVNLHPQQEQLVLLVEETAGRRVAVVSRDESGDYRVSLSPALPEGTSLDDFHAGENEIELQFNDQQWMAGYRKRTDGAWRLSWVMGDVDYAVSWYGVEWFGAQEDERLIGSLPGADLMSADFDAIPRTKEALIKAVDAGGWAVVSNPNPQDRLHLRARPGKSADSLGKFYNGTPLRVLETRGDWCRVAIGNDGLTGWMMKNYLAFSEAANAVSPAFPDLFLREEYQGRDMAAWADCEKKTPRMLTQSEAWEIMGVMDEMYILVSRDTGSVVYAPASWFWEGNG